MTLHRLLLCPVLALALASAPELGHAERYRVPRVARPDTETVQERMRSAARNSTLEPWQRGIMLRLAAGEPPEKVGRDPQPAAASAPASGTGVETWVPIPGPARYGHSGIYDPIRQRLIVFGGDAGFNGISLYGNDVWA